MALLQIPIRNDFPNYEFRITLDSVIYIIAIRFNTRKDRWIMDIKNSDDTYNIMGIPILVNQDLIGRYAVDNKPKGILFTINVSDENVNPTEEEFSVNVLLLYNEAT